MNKNLEWLSEPNKLEWEYEGYKCIILRDKEYGNLCAYVGLNTGHPWYGKEAADREIYDIDVYNHIAWAHQEHPAQKYDDIFIYAPSKLWWLGFHASGSKDFRPFYNSNRPDATYKNMAFMKAECEKLVRQCQFRKEKQQKKVAVSVSQIEAQINQDKDMLKNLMLQIIDHGYAALDTYNRGSGGGVRPRYDNLELIQATNMLIDMVKWGKFNTAEKEAKDKNGAEKKPYTCECKFKESSDEEPIKIIEIGVCENKDPENIRLCKLATKIWRYLRRSLDGRGFGNVWMQIINSGDYCEVNTELRLNVFKTLAEEANAKP